MGHLELSCFEKASFETEGQVLDPLNQKTIFSRLYCELPILSLDVGHPYIGMVPDFTQDTGKATASYLLFMLWFYYNSIWFLLQRKSSYHPFRHHFFFVLYQKNTRNFLRLGVWLKWKMTGTKNFLFLFYIIPLISELFQAI